MIARCPFSDAHKEKGVRINLFTFILMTDNQQAGVPFQGDAGHPLHPGVPSLGDAGHPLYSGFRFQGDARHPLQGDNEHILQEEQVHFGDSLDEVRVQTQVEPHGASYNHNSFQEDNGSSQGSQEDLLRQSDPLPPYSEWDSVRDGIDGDLTPLSPTGGNSVEPLTPGGFSDRHIVPSGDSDEPRLLEGERPQNRPVEFVRQSSRQRVRFSSIASTLSSQSLDIQNASSTAEPGNETRLLDILSQLNSISADLAVLVNLPPNQLNAQASRLNPPANQLLDQRQWPANQLLETAHQTTNQDFMLTHHTSNQRTEHVEQENKLFNRIHQPNGQPEKQIELREENEPSERRVAPRRRSKDQRWRSKDAPPAVQAQYPGDPVPAPSFHSNRAKSENARLNVGGRIFYVSWDLLEKKPTSRLGLLAESRTLKQALRHCDNYDPWTDEFYFNYRHRNVSDILTYYRTDSLHITTDCCSIAFIQDLTYWGFSESCLESCCLKRYVDFKECLDWDNPEATADTDIEVFPEGKKGTVQKALWDLFEHPHTSMSARVVGIVSVTCIFISTIILTLETLPYFQDNDDQIMGDFSVFAIIEAVYMSWFTIEFIVRLVCCPCKIDFIRKTMNWIDLLAIIPYYVTVVLHSYGMGGEEAAPATQGEEHQLHNDDAVHYTQGEVSRTAQYFRLLKIARIVKTLRIIRIFKLARHSTGLQALGNTMKANYKELGLLFLLLGMGAIMFASLIYVFEKEDPESSFKTMFDAYWWAIITMTTVGYGDEVPVTGVGKVIGCFCAIFGVLVIGLPIPIIGNSFNKFYARQKRWEKREAIAKSRENREQKRFENMSLRRQCSVRIANVVAATRNKIATEP